MKKDFRKNQKVIALLTLEDKGQDFTELDVLENGVILGNSIIFEKGKLSMMGVGTLNGKDYWDFDEIKEDMKDRPLGGFYIYIKNTDEQTPLPWEAKTLNYKIVDVKKPVNINRFSK